MQNATHNVNWAILVSTYKANLRSMCINSTSGYLMLTGAELEKNTIRQHKFCLEHFVFLKVIIICYLYMQNYFTQISA